MDWIQAALLGLLQGITEFLPVSSSGHLAVAQRLFGLNPPDEIFFSVCVHLGSLLAVVLYFKAEIKELLIGLYLMLKQLPRPKGFPELLQSHPACKMNVYLILATFVTGILGLLFHSFILQSFANGKSIGLSWLVTGSLLLVAQLKLIQPPRIKEIDSKDSLFIGLLQALALLPGISRSGATLTAGLIRGLRREEAFRFAFLLSVPAILIAFAAEAAQTGGELIQSGKGWIYLTGLGVSALASYAALALLRWMVLRKQLTPFIIYCFSVGLLALLFIH